jgi:23S rRNA pseudouridine955/2504/2580 synthase
VAGVPSIEEGLIDLPLAKQPGTGGEKMMVDKSEQGQPARSRYRVLDRAGNRACWVELQPLTGRTHQLRVHMAAIGHPIRRWQVWRAGSLPFGQHQPQDAPARPPPDHRASRRHAAGCGSPLPDHFAASLAQLGFDEAEGEYIPDPSGDPTREGEKAAAKAHAKQYRKERRGERRGRAETGAPAQMARVRPPTRASLPPARNLPPNRRQTRRREEGPGSKPAAPVPPLAAPPLAAPRAPCRPPLLWPRSSGPRKPR